MEKNGIDIAGAAKGLARNPLGVIALFLVLVYGIASLLTAFSGALSHEERLPLIYFLVCFPLLVLGVFGWLVSSHNVKLFAPADFKDESNYVKMLQFSAVGSLVAAEAKSESTDFEPDISRLVEVVEGAFRQRVTATGGWRNRVLWVDDRPDNNDHERRAFQAIGLHFSIALSTSEALEAMKREQFAAVISDMGRKEGPREGYVLLDALRANGNLTPVFFYATSNAPEHKRETYEHGGQGCTNNAQELFQMVTRAVINCTN